VLERAPVPRRVMTLFFVVDTSGSMEGKRIGAVNTAIEEVIPAIQEVAAGNSDAEIKIAALEFSSGARWITQDGPVALQDFHWKDLEAAGVTDMGAAFLALNEKLSTKGFMKEATGSFAPAIFLLSDGEPFDDWESGLAKLKENKWFKPAVKVAVFIGDDDNGKDVLAKFTGSTETVLTTSNSATLKKMIKFIAVTSSQVASKSSNAGAGDKGDEAKQEELAAALQELKEEIADSPVNDQDDL